MKKGDGSQQDWQVDDLYTSIFEAVVIVSRKRNISATKVDQRVIEVEVVSFELLLSSSATNPPIGESRGNFNAVHELVHDGPQTFRGICCSGAMQRKD